MSQTEVTNEVVTDEATTTAAAPAAVASPKTPSKKSLAQAIFDAKLVERSQGLFGSNKEFRAAVLNAIQTQLGVTSASAATMYNASKKDAETADVNIKLGRDPKKEVVKNTSGKRGRPQGSKNKPKVVEPAGGNVTVLDPFATASEATPATEDTVAEAVSAS
jgi:DNA-binding transcriptional regulator YiaG